MDDLNADLLVDSTDTLLISDLVDELSLQIVDHGATRRHMVPVFLKPGLTSFV